MTLFTLFIESLTMSKCPTIISSRSRGNNFSNVGEITKSQKKQQTGIESLNKMQEGIIRIT
jgi:hypothetical protein